MSGIRTEEQPKTQELIDDSYLQEILYEMDATEKRTSEDPGIPVRRRIVQDTDEMRERRQRGMLSTSLSDIVLATAQFSRILSKYIGDFTGLTMALKNEEDRMFEAREPDGPKYYWRKDHTSLEYNIEYEKDAEVAAKQLISFYYGETDTQSLIDSDPYGSIGMLPETIQEYPLRHLTRVYEYGRYVLLEFLAERYADIVTENGIKKDIEVTINTNTGEKKYSASKVAEEINKKFKEMTVSYITKLDSIPMPRIAGDAITENAIPVNAKLLFKPLLYTYWRLATYMVSLYTWSFPYDSIGMYKFPNRFIIKLFNRETSEGKIRIRSSPNPSNDFFYYLFPGNGGPPRVKDITKIND